MYLLGSEITVRWQILPSDIIIDREDLDLLITSPDGSTHYLDSAVLPQDYAPYSATSAGLAKYKITPNAEGKWVMSLVVGDKRSYQILSRVDIFVFDSVSQTPPIRVAVGDDHTVSPLPTGSVNIPNVSANNVYLSLILPSDVNAPAGNTVLYAPLTQYSTTLAYSISDPVLGLTPYTRTQADYENGFYDNSLINQTVPQAFRVLGGQNCIATLPTTDASYNTTLGTGVELFSATNRAIGLDKSYTLEFFLYYDDQNRNSEFGSSPQDYPPTFWGVGLDVYRSRVSVTRDGRLYWENNLEAYEALSAQPIPQRQWVHVALIREGRKLALFVDGALSYQDDTNDDGENFTENHIDSWYDVPNWPVAMRDKQPVNVMLGALEDIGVEAGVHSVRLSIGTNRYYVNEWLNGDTSVVYSPSSIADAIAY